MRWGQGVGSVGELLDLGAARELIDKSGNHMSFADVGDGRERSREALAGNEELQRTL